VGQPFETGPVSAGVWPGVGIAADARPSGRMVAAARSGLPRIMRALAWLALAAAVVVIALIPLGYAIDAQFYKETRVGLSGERSLAAARDVYFGVEYWGYLASAMLLAGLVTLFSVIVGVLLAFLVGRTDLKRKSLWDMAITLPLYLSPFTGLMAWIALGSEKTGFVNGLYTGLMSVFTSEPRALINIWSYGGVVFVMFLFFCPFVYLFTVGSLRAMNGSLEEAARISGASPLQTTLKITLPICSPAILAAGLLVFVLAAETYTIPGIIGANAGFTVLPWKIFEDSVAAPVHRAHAAAGGTMLLFVTIAGVWLQRRLTRVAERFVTVGGKGSQTPPIPLGRWTPAALALILAYVLAADILPFGALLISSLMKYSSGTLTADIFTTRHYQMFFTTQNMVIALWNTVFLALLAGIACVLMGFVISLSELRRPNGATKLLAFLSVLPVAVPGLVYGIGLVWTWLQTPVYGTVWILLIAYVAKFLSYGVVVSRSGLLQMHPELEESARVCGAGTMRTVTMITMPILKPTLMAILFFVMLMSIKELSASVLLYTQDSQVLSVLTWHYMDSGDYQFAAAIGVIQTLIMIGLVVAVRALFGVRMESAFSR
jgi:iron(III) transport system permease protein